MSDQRFRSSDHLRRKDDFKRVYARRCSEADDILIVYVDDNGLRNTRLGLSVGKRAGNAVRRNRLRRQLREAFRTNKTELPTGVDIICIPRAARGTKPADFRQSLRFLVTEAAKRLRRSRRGRPINRNSEPPSR